MAVTLNASSTAGFVTTADTSTILQLQTNGTTAVTVDTSQNVTLVGTLTTSSRGIAKASMPTGSVLQVVTGIYSLDTSTTSTNFVDTGLTATITPSATTSKILVLVTMPGVYKASTVAAASVSLQILRAATTIHLSTGINFNNTTTQLLTAFSASVLDSPNTTSATIYKLQIASGNGNQVISNLSANASATITLMEIAA